MDCPKNDFECPYKNSKSNSRDGLTWLTIFFIGGLILWRLAYLYQKAIIWTSSIIGVGLIIWGIVEWRKASSYEKNTVKLLIKIGFGVIFILIAINIIVHPISDINL